MTAGEWERIRAVFDEAASLRDTDREEFLRKECGNEPDICEAVRHMLKEDGRSGFLDRPAGTKDRPRSFEPGAVIAGRYRIVRWLGRGGMGEVYEADQLELNECVAIKTLLPEICADPQMIDRFKQEIQLSRKIAHPNVCKVFDLARHPADGSTPDVVFFLSMEFVAGETLRDKLRRERRVSPAAALPIIEQIADALDAVHRAGVIHRDLKPSNVMLTTAPDGSSRAVVMDFGLARMVAPPKDSTVTISGHLAGTLEYMAPELFTGGPASAASDIYALGLVVYEMVTGELPERALRQIPPARSKAPEIDAAWDRALSRALDRQPERRFQSANDFVRALRGDSVSVMVRLPVMTRRRVAAAFGTGMLLVAALLGWSGWGRARNRPSREAEGLYEKGVADLDAGAHFAATKALEQAVGLSPNFTLSHARLAEAWVGLELPEKASQEMLVARRQDVAGLAKLDRLRVDAIDLTITRDFAAAAAKYEEIANASPPDAVLALDLGRAYANAGQREKAIASYRRAAEMAAHNPAAWLQLAILYSRERETVKADEAFRQAEEQYQLTSNSEGLIEVAFQKGAAADTLDQFEAGAKYLHKALETAQFIGNVQQEVRAKLELGTNAYQVGDAATAERYAREGLDTAQANKIDSLAIRGLVGLASAYSRKRDFAGAERYYLQAVSLARATASKRLGAYALLSLASLHDQKLQSNPAASEAAEALAYYQPNAFVRQTAQCLVIIGRAHMRKGEFDQALDVFQLASVAAKKAQDQGLETLAEESLGKINEAEERFPEALEYYKRELTLSRTAEQRAYAGAHYGHVLWILGDYNTAASVFDAAGTNAGNFPALQMNLQRMRADMLLSQGRNADAMKLARKLLAGDPAPDVASSAELTDIWGLALSRTGHAREGLTQCRNGLELARGVRDEADLLGARLAVLEGLIATGDRQAARSVFAEMEPTFGQHPVSRWRALALVSAADPQYRSSAAEALTGIKTSWGDSAFAQYLSRPDMGKLAWPFLQGFSAIHK
jgi:tetratricopeptide (TPR) repeat protein